MPGSRLSDVIVKMPDRSTCRVERRLVKQQNATGDTVTRFVCSLPTGDPVLWLSEGKYRMPDGAVGIAVAHKSPLKDRDSKAR